MVEAKDIRIPEAEIEMSAIRAQGSGGQNVNKVSTAIHLRFDVMASSLPSYWKARILQQKDRRISKEGVIVIKVQDSRSQEFNKETAVLRLKEFIAQALVIQKMRKPTKVGKGAQAKRLDRKSQRSKVKSTRGKVRDW